VAMHAWWNTNEPNIAFTIKLAARGALRLGEQSVNLPAITIERSKYDVAEPWKLRAILSEADSRLLFDWNWKGPPFDSEIVGQTDAGDSFRIGGAVGWELHGREFSLDVHEIDFGLGRMEQKPTSQYISIYLTDTALVQRRPTSGTELKRDYHPEAVPFTWVSPFGPLEFERVDDTERAKVSSVGAKVEVPRVVLWGPATTISDAPADVVAELEKALKPVFAVLSLLSRSRVSSTRIVVASRSMDASPPEMTDFTRWRSVVVSERTVSRFPLVSPTDLERAEIDMLSRRLAAFEGAERLIAATYFLASWMDTTFLEERIVNAFTSLETVVSGLPNLPDADQLTATDLLKLLRADLLKHAPDYPPTLVERAGRALDGMNRRPIAKRVAALAEKYDLYTADLWLPYVGVESGVREAYQHRNAIIHRGELGDADKASAAAYRIHALAERLLYAAIGGIQAKMHQGAYRHLRDLPA
jgi:hypothetical protein